MSQRSLAEALSKAGYPITGAAIGFWERGDWYPSPEHLQAVESLFDVPSTLAVLTGRAGPSTEELEQRIVELERRLDELEG